MRFLSLVVFFTAFYTFAAEPQLAEKAKATYEAKVKNLTEGYEAAIKRYDEILEKELTIAEKEYIEQLEFARKNALIRNNLDEAQRLSEIKKSLETKKSLTKSSYKKSNKPWFVGTVWYGSMFNKCTYTWFSDYCVEQNYKLPNRPIEQKTSWFLLDEDTVMTVCCRHSGVPGKPLAVYIWKFDNTKKNAKVAYLVQPMDWCGDGFAEFKIVKQ